MNNPFNNRLVGVFQDVTVEGIIKVFFVGGLLMYCMFAIVVVRQVGVMEETIEARYNKVLGFLSWLHLAMAIGIVVVAMMIL